MHTNGIKILPKKDDLKNMMNPNEVVAIAAKALNDKKGQDIKVLKTDKLTSLCDYFVICTGTSSTHIKTLTDEIDKQMSDVGEPPIRREGYRSGNWVLLDFGCVVAHVFTEEAREFYKLERLWSDAEEIDLSSLIGPC